MSTLRKIAYLAPEIPALSATFVYNEIFAMEKQGVEVLPISVHQPHAPAKGEEVEALKQATIILYGNSLLALLQSNLKTLFSHPLRYLRTFGTLFKDMLCLKSTPRTAVGQLYRFLVASKLAAILKSHHCQHIHVHFAHVPTDIAMYASSLSDIPFSVTAHANDIFERGWLLRQKCQRAKFFATISEFNKRYLLTKQCDEKKIEIIRCGVDSQLFQQRPARPIQRPAKIGLVGRFVEKKGIETLLQAAAVLRQDGVEIKVELAGDGPLLGEMKSLVQSLGIEGDVTFLGSLPHHAVSGFITSLDIFALPCVEDSQGDKDGIPVVLMEAMLSGVPVISSRLSGIPELVVDDQTGYLIDPKNINQLIEAIKMMISQPETTQRLINNAVTHVANEYDLFKNAQKLKSLIEQDS